MAEREDNKASILSTLGDIENSVFDVLLQLLFDQLKVPDPRLTPSFPMVQPVLLPGMLSCHAISCPSDSSSLRALGQVTSQH